MLDGIGFQALTAAGAQARQQLREKLKLWAIQKSAELRANRRLVFGDALASAFSVFVAMALAYGGAVPNAMWVAMLPLMALASLTGFVAFTLLDFYRRHSRSTSVRDITIISRGAAVAITAQGLIASVLPLTQAVPLSVFLIQFLATVPFLGSLRIVARSRELIRRDKREQKMAEEQTPVLLVGTGTNCDLFLRSLRNTQTKYVPIGIIDDVRDTTGLYFHYVKILGSVRDPKAAVAALQAAGEKPAQLLLTEPVSHFESKGMFELLSWASTNGIKVSRLPGLGDPEVEDEAKTGPTLRTVDPEEILNRPQMAVENSLLRELFQGRRVLITGAGGSIGSELSRQIASFDPSMLILVDNCEFNAYSIDMDLARHYPDVNRQVLIASIRDATRVKSIFKRFQPELVFNAAALKHVPMVELNPCEGVLTNVIGTRNIADAARSVGAIAMVQVSTDKAVNTTNVMGATKRVAEFYVQAQDRITNQTQEGTRFFSVRFGNVLGSSGSLIPLFQRQISEGGPLTVTDARMERFFMTIREAVQLTTIAAAKGLAQNTGLGEIFVLDMGEPVKIVDLAERMIRLAGLEPYRDIDIDFVGIRPGEKLFEELFDKAEQRHESGIEGVQSALPDGIPMAHLRGAIVQLELAARAGDEGAVRRQLQDLVPGYGRATLRDVTSDTQRLPTQKPVRRAPIAGPMRQPDAQATTEQRLWAGE
ncbi:nucleoside-diphosphate sugar epimerase/dehydratase [uncultured Aliiroseovarius sp.]|uniref:polysaccharide biosynthesis protein n=1 Tax=uncultured Aliiroseovarius sp. TaxID=1658783 RepID=UPI00262E4E50|nr:nucleoside-diphosphate sugar epimerase/dehydratase [uncultured Aliiroseovarius sp.]